MRLLEEYQAKGHRCAYCRERLPKGRPGVALQYQCRKCREAALQQATVFDRDAQIGAIPANLVRYYSSALNERVTM